MKNTISYENLSGKEKQEKAINDIKGYFCNEKAFDSIVGELKTIQPNKRSFNNLLIPFGMFSGISGYPVIALLSDTWKVPEETLYSWIEEEENAGS